MTALCVAQLTRQHYRQPTQRPAALPPLLHIALALGIAAGTITGCSSEQRVGTATVLANTNCKGVSNGLAEVSLAEVAGFRGSQLIFSESSPSASPGSEPLPIFISISRGAQPSRGFELHLSDQARAVSATDLAIDVYWSEPDLTRPQPQVTTNPCLVVSVPERQWLSIEAIDQHGASLGTLTRTPRL